MPRVDSAMTILRTFAWLFGVLYASIPPYWLFVHPFAERWRRRGAKLKHVGPIWIILWFVIAGATWPWHKIVLYTSWWAWVPAAILFAIAFSIYVLATKDFTHDQLVGRSEIEPQGHEQRLNTSGIRARMRHPLYFGHVLHLLGWTIGSGLAVMYGLLAFAIITGAWMIRAEEKELIRRFGDEYREYQRRSPLILPRF